MKHAGNTDQNYNEPPRRLNSSVIGRHGHRDGMTNVIRICRQIGSRKPTEQKCNEAPFHCYSSSACLGASPNRQVMPIPM
jgi:hypothetical protein